MKLRFWVVSTLLCLVIPLCSCSSEQGEEFQAVNSNAPTATAFSVDGENDFSAQAPIITQSPSSDTVDEPTETEGAVTSGEPNGEDTAKYTPNY